MQKNTTQNNESGVSFFRSDKTLINQKGLSVVATFKKGRRIFVLLFFLCIVTNFLHAQNMGIGTPNPDPSAMLDITDSTRGLLIPRVKLSTAEFPCAGPSKGLLVLNIDKKFKTGTGIYINQGNNTKPLWRMLATVSDSSGQLLLLSTINDLINTVNPANTILVTDSLRGGIFYYSSKSLKADNAVVFPATGRNSGAWVRSYTPGIATPATWYGASKDSTIKSNNAAIQKMIAAKVPNIFISQGIPYSFDSLTQTSETIFYDNNDKSVSYGASSGFQLPLSGDSHIALRAKKAGRNAGLWVQPNGPYPSKKDVGGTYCTIKLMYDDFEGQRSIDSRDYRDLTITTNDGGLNNIGASRINSTVNGNFLGQWPSVEFTFQNTAYRTMALANLQPSVALAGGKQFYDFKSADSCYWYPGKIVNAGSLMLNNFIVYQSVSGGTCGSTRPTWTSGAQSDGGVQWQFIENISPVVSGKLFRPAAIFGNYGIDPIIGFNDCVAQFGENILMHPATSIRFANGQKNEAAPLITRLNSITKGIKIQSDSAANKYFFVSDTRFGGVNLPMVSTIVVKPDGAATADISTSNVFSFTDSQPVNFTAFTKGISGQLVTVNFVTGNTTLINSTALKLGGANIKPSANTTFQFFIGSASNATLITYKNTDTSFFKRSGNKIQPKNTGDTLQVLNIISDNSIISKVASTFTSGGFTPLVRNNTSGRLEQTTAGYTRVHNVAASLILNDTYNTLLADATTGDLTITLPPALTYFSNNYGISYVIMKTDSSLNKVIIQASGSETINGSNSFIINTQNATKTVVTNGVSWYITAN